MNFFFSSDCSSSQIASLCLLDFPAKHSLPGQVAPLPLETHYPHLSHPHEFVERGRTHLPPAFPKQPSSPLCSSSAVFDAVPFWWLRKLRVTERIPGYFFQEIYVLLRFPFLLFFGASVRTSTLMPFSNLFFITLLKSVYILLFSQLYFVNPFATSLLALISPS